MGDPALGAHVEHGDLPAGADLGENFGVRFAGLGGDVLGAVQQAGEILTLLVAVAAGSWGSPVSWVIAFQLMPA